MNSRQRRGVVLLVVSALCAVAAFAGVLTVVSDARSEVGPKVTAYRLAKDVAAYETVKSAQLQKVQIPERYVPSTAIRNLGQLSGKIAAVPLKKGSLLQSDMVAARPALEAGQMEIAIMIDAETGVAGKITPGALVNIFATFKPEDDKQPDISQIIVTHAKVIDVGEIRAFDGNDSTRRAASQGVPITFALDARNAQRVAFAESFAVHVRLALVAPGDTSTPDTSDRTYTLPGLGGTS